MLFKLPTLLIFQGSTHLFGVESFSYKISGGKKQVRKSGEDALNAAVKLCENMLRLKRDSLELFELMEEVDEGETFYQGNSPDGGLAFIASFRLIAGHRRKKTWTTMKKGNLYNGYEKEIESRGNRKG